jgi:hypothetical protein
MNKPSSEQILEAVDSNPKLQKKVIKSLHQREDSVHRISRFCGGLQNRLWRKAQELGSRAIEGYRAGREGESNPSERSES